MNTSIARVIAGALAASAAYIGGWAMAMPHSFFTTFPGLGVAWVAPLGAYNEHLVRDVGGLYAALLVFSGWTAAKGDATASIPGMGASSATKRLSSSAIASIPPGRAPPPT